VSVLDNVIQFVKVVGSAVLGPNSAVLHNVTGIGGFRTNAAGEVVSDDDGDDAGEQAHEQPVYSGLGVVGRPLPPDTRGFLEAMAARVDDGLETFAYRDLRINRALNPTSAGTAPAAGQVGIAGYGGGFASVRQASAESGSGTPDVFTIYVPYEFNGAGVPTKAHAIIVDPTPGNSSLQLVHGDGVFFTLSEDTGDGPGIVAAVGASTFLRMSAGKLTLQATEILLKGNCYLGRGADPTAFLPLLAGAASPPSPSIFVSPV
jgi:hypothetical protein